MPRRRLSEGTGCLILLYVLFFFVLPSVAIGVERGEREALIFIGGIVLVHIIVGIVVSPVVDGIWWYEDRQKKKKQQLREQEQEAKRLHALKLAEEERQKQLREQEEQRRREEEERRFRALELADVDNMSSGEFEQYVGKLMKRRGYKTRVIGKAGDMGVDVVAQNGAKKYAVQVKRYNQPVSRRAVSDAVAGKDHYGCNAAMVVTNNYFTKGAMDLARSTKCQLVDRDTLADWIVDLRAKTNKGREQEESHTQVESEELSAGADPRFMQLGIRMAAFHIEAGARSFGQYARKMVGEFGDKVRPYLAGWYKMVRSDPDFAPFREGMTTDAKVDRLSEPKVLDAILSGEADEDENGIVWRQKREVHVENERTPPAPSPPPTPPATTDNTHPNHQGHLAKKQLIEQLNRHPLNQKARELLKQLGEPNYPEVLSILLLLFRLAEDPPEGVDPNIKYPGWAMEWALIDLLQPLGDDKETMDILLGRDEDGITITDRDIAEVTSPQEMIDLLAETLSDLLPPNPNRVED